MAETSGRLLSTLTLALTMVIHLTNLTIGRLLSTLTLVRWMILIMLTAMAVMELLPKIPTPTRASIRTKPAVVR